MANNDYDYLFKIILIGNSGVGKSSIMNCLTKKDFKSSHISTIGVDFDIFEFKIDDKIVKLQIWDTAGAERFDSITTSYYRGAHEVLIVYDVSDKDSFESVKNKWLVNVRKYGNKDIFILVAGNKCDLMDLETYENAMVELNNIQHIFTSAKENVNIMEIFEEMIKSMVENDRMINMVEKKPLSYGGIISPQDTDKSMQCCYH